MEQLNRKDESIENNLNSEYKLLSEDKRPITLTVMLKMKLEPRHITLVDAAETLAKVSVQFQYQLFDCLYRLAQI